jgi:hypothetical protein
MTITYSKHTGKLSGRRGQAYICSPSPVVRKAHIRDGHTVVPRPVPAGIHLNCKTDCILIGSMLVMLRFVLLCFVMLCFVMVCYVMLCYVMLCYVMLCYVMLCYVVLCYVILCNVMLCYLYVNVTSCYIFLISQIHTHLLYVIARTYFLPVNIIFA